MRDWLKIRPPSRSLSFFRPFLKDTFFSAPLGSKMVALVRSPVRWSPLLVERGNFRLHVLQEYLGLFDAIKDL